MTKSIKRQSLDNFLKENLSYSDYTNLPVLINESRRFTTMLLRNPALGTIKNLKALLTLLKKNNPEITIEKLINDFNFGITNKKRVA